MDKMLKWFSVLTVVSFCFRYTTGLHCWECENAYDDKHCQEIGVLRKCHDNQQTCETEFRLVPDRYNKNGLSFTIDRRCKQDLACYNNLIQNNRPAWWPTQCNDRQGSVCRCCCAFDGCNEANQFACQIVRDPVRMYNCVKIDWIPDGTVTCESETTFSKNMVTCRFKCNEGFRLWGPEISKCETDFFLKPKPMKVPVCIPNRFGKTPDITPKALQRKEAKRVMRCPYVNYFSNGQVCCDSESSLYTSKVTCHYNCDEGYKLMGNSTSVCISNVDTYYLPTHHIKPACKLLSYNADILVDCPVISAPTNGYILCSDESIEEGTFCQFTCNEGYKLFGQYVVTCVQSNWYNGNEWNSEPPTCDKIQCGDDGTDLRRVNRDCSDENSYGTVCKYTCKYPYVPADELKMENFCQLNGTWMNPAPCCSLPCPPNSMLDIVVLIDSSISHTFEQWQNLVAFVSELIGNFKLGADANQAYVLQYTDQVDAQNTHLFNKGETASQILKVLQDRLPQMKQRLQQRKRTGVALSHVRNNLLYKRGIPPVVLLLSDGRSGDHVFEISRQLREEGAQMFAIGIGNTRVQELVQITGSLNRVWTRNITNTEYLIENVPDFIGFDVCRNSC